ncbi:MAG TPA: alkaline phosphatase family protein [Solirubrobacteraceae bacterium]|nr:alkaline phosphatase family protein [Solirubrobacteraceae bacterium]
MSVSAEPVREPGSRPSPDEAPGSSNPDMPFEHLVVVMMENHSFDNLLGALSLTRTDVHGLTFEDGKATNSNPGGPGTPPVVTAFPLTNTSQGSDVSQTWKDSHDQIDGGRMDGFVRTMNSEQPMGYYTPAVLPFAYSLASTFTVANQWFSSLPGPTYPNRRFLLAGTAYGTTQTRGDPLLADSPPSGTVFDLLSNQGISWADYFSDLPMSVVIGRSILDHADHHHVIDTFFEDCRTGSLPQVSFVDPRIGVASRIGQPIAQLPFPFDEWLKRIDADLSNADPAETEEDPQDMYYGEAWAYRVVTSVIQSPVWPQTCLIYLYDEHGGYYDHVAPPAAIPPDDIKPILQPGDPDGGYDMYGPRVPAIVVSPHSKPGATTDVVHDHTSVLATIEAKWNLPALTRRDANARDIMDFLDPGPPALLHPTGIAPPQTTGPSGPVGPIN